MSVEIGRYHLYENVLIEVYTARLGVSEFCVRDIARFGRPKACERVNQVDWRIIIISFNSTVLRSLVILARMSSEDQVRHLCFRIEESTT